VLSEVKHITALWFHHWSRDSPDSKKEEQNNTAQEDKKIIQSANIQKVMAVH